MLALQRLLMWRIINVLIITIISIIVGSKNIVLYRKTAHSLSKVV